MSSYRVHIGGEVHELERRDAIELAIKKRKAGAIVEAPNGRWRALASGRWERMDVWNAIARAAIAEQLERNPKRQMLLLELLSRPWGSLPPPWAFAPRRHTLLCVQYSQAREAAICAGMTRDKAQVTAMTEVVQTMKNEGLWPSWMSLKKYAENRNRLARRAGLL